MSAPHRHESDFEGIPLGRPEVPRREQAEETHKILELVRQRQKTEEENRHLRYVAYHDRLTGLPNDRAFEEAFEHAVTAATTKGEPVGLAILDIDGLKFANDELGHAEGNVLIKAVGVTLQQHIRPDDILFHLSGDEFACIMPGYSPDAAKGQTQEELDTEKTKTFRNAADKVIEKMGLPTTRVSLSTGIASLNQGEIPDDFFRRVDSLLYVNKRTMGISRPRSID